MLKKELIRAKVQSAKKMPINDAMDLQGVSNNRQNEAEKRQELIDEYNFNVCLQPDNFFDQIQIEHGIIIQLFKENYIKDIDVIDNNVFYDAWLSQVDGRMNRAEPEKWIDNPLPYITVGVVKAISPVIEMEYEKRKNDYKYSFNKEMKCLEVGDIVYLKHFMFADVRFYKNQQKRDFIKNPNEYRIQHWEGHVHIHQSLIDGIVIDKDKFINELSPYKTYKNNA